MAKEAQNWPDVIKMSSRGSATPRGTDEIGARRIGRLTDRLVDELRFNRTLVCGTDSVGDVDEWRRAARRAGRRLGIVIRTGVSYDGTRVWVTEGP